MKNCDIVPLAASHASELFAAMQDPEIQRFAGPYNDLSAFERRCARLERDTTSPDGRERWLNWAVFVDAAIAGYVQATVRLAKPAGTRSADVAYVLGAAFRGHGYATLAMRQMLTRLPLEHGVAEVWVTIHEDNLPSIRVAQRLGFTTRNPDEYPGDNFAKGDVAMRLRL